EAELLRATIRDRLNHTHEVLSVMDHNYIGDFLVSLGTAVGLRPACVWLDAEDQVRVEVYGETVEQRPPDRTESFSLTFSRSLTTVKVVPWKVGGEDEYPFQFCVSERRWRRGRWASFRDLATATGQPVAFWRGVAAAAEAVAE